MKNLKLHFLLLFIALTAICQAQEKKGIFGKVQLDSLEAQVDQLYIHGKYSDLIGVLNSLTKHYRTVNNLNKIYSIQLRVADVNRATQNFDNSFKILNKLLKTVPWGNREFRAKLYYTKSATYFETDSLPQAKSYAKTALSIAKATENLNIIAGSYNLLGAIFRTENIDSALYYNHLAASTFLKAKDTMNLALAYYNLGSSLNTINQPDSSIYYSNKSLAIAKQFNVPTYQLLALNNLVASNIALKKFELALNLIGMRDSLEKEVISTKNAVKINQLMEQIEEEKEAQEKALLIDKLSKDEELNTRKNLFLTLAIFLVFLLVIFLVIIYRKDQIRKKDLKQVEKLNKDIQEYSTKMSELNNAKDKVLSIISHDLRSPFSQLITFLSFADEGELTEEDMKVVNKEMLLSSRNGLHILDNLLYWANNQKEGRKLVKHNFIVAESLNEIKNQTDYLAKNKKVKIKIDCSLKLTLNADKVLFEIVLRNLLSNAIKFSPINDEIKVVVSQRNKNIEISIKDNGSGIPAEVVKALDANNLEYRSAPGTIGEKGAGMGLYLSMEFARRNNGIIRFDLQNKGTKAVFSIPQE